MFKYTSIREALLKESKRNEQLRAQNLKQQSDIDYIAMMCDVELEAESEEVQENEQI